MIDESGEQLGVVTPEEGLRRAREAGLDLIEVAPTAQPPVCKIIDYGKYKYEQQKKAAEARKKQKTVDVKEIKMRPGIEEHDYETKFKNAKRFLGEGNKVKFTIRFRGRELTHKEIGREVLDRFVEDLKELGKIESPPKLEGRQMTMIVAPFSQKS